MPLHLFITRHHRKHLAEEKIAELEMGSDAVILTISNNFGILDLVKSIRIRRPDTIWLDSDLDITTLRLWFTTINDAIITHDIDCYVYSYGDKPTSIPEIIHIGKPFPPSIDDPRNKNFKGP